MLSPAVATSLFFLLESVVSWSSDPAVGHVAAAAASTPTPTRVVKRAVAAIPEAREARASTTPVPSTEREMLRLLDVRRTVVFASEEVDAVETRAERFDVDEVAAIRGIRARR